MEELDSMLAAATYLAYVVGVCVCTGANRRSSIFNELPNRDASTLVAMIDNYIKAANDASFVSESPIGQKFVAMSQVLSALSAQQ